jgi:hypothetical protein
MNEGKFSLNPSHGIKKSKTKRWYVHNVNAKDFITKTWQEHNKDTYPKLVLNKLKVIWDFTSIYTH